jgi:hypothetical protein
MYLTKDNTVLCYPSLSMYVILVDNVSLRYYSRSCVMNAIVLYVLLQLYQTQDVSEKSISSCTDSNY